MLKLQKEIDRGATRICYGHPDTPNLCVKVYIDANKKLNEIQQEINIYKALKEQLAAYLCFYKNELVETDKGVGLVCELLRDDNGQISQSLVKCKRPLTPEIIAQIHNFTDTLIKEKIYFYDFNIKNFALQIKNGKPQLKYIDLKSYNKYKPWTYLHLEKIIPYLAQRALRQRIKKFYTLLKKYKYIE